MAEKSSIDVWLDELIAEVKKREAALENKKKHSYVADLIRVLMPYKIGLSRQTVLHNLERQRRSDGLPIPAKFEQAVQSSYNRYSVDSYVFKKRNALPEEGVFYSPEGKYSGRWALNRERAATWLEGRLKEIRE